MTRQFVSYPKSGRSWIRYALSLAAPEMRVRFHHDGFEFNDGSRPAHDFSRAARLERYGPDDRIVYLARDPRDVMCSLYAQVTGRFDDFFGYEGDLSAFLRDPYFGAPVLRRFRGMWTEIARSRDVLCVTYEGMTRDPEATLASILAHYGHPVDPVAVAEAARRAAFDEMRSIERAGAFHQPWLRPRNGHFKVRRGRVGGYRDELGAADIAYLEEVFGPPARG